MGLSDPSDPLRVFLADDSPIVRQRLATLLSELDGIEIVGQAQTALDVSDSIRKLNPDVVLLDIVLSGEIAIDLVHAIKQQSPAPTVIVCTNHPYPQYRRKCLEAGADFFLDKCLDSAKLVELVRRLVTERANDTNGNEG
jgi:DNA-binding NarL/FixJ family response regulator